MRPVADYAFISHWRLDAPIDAVWDAIYRSDDWPSWWRDVQRVQLLERGDENGLGALRRYWWRTKLPYSFVFDTRTVRIQPPHVLEAEASGELVGTGLWQLRQEAGAVHVQYDWRVRTTKPWMNLLAPVMRPAFALNHTVVMRRGARDLARHLSARLLSAS